jgi:hypothetical protein
MCMLCAVCAAESAAPSGSGSPEGDNQATVREQLNKLNEEADTLTAEIKKTFDGLLGAPDNELFKMRYTDLKAKEERLDERRKALEAQLTGEWMVLRMQLRMQH